MVNTWGDLVSAGIKAWNRGRRPDSSAGRFVLFSKVTDFDGKDGTLSVECCYRVLPEHHMEKFRAASQQVEGSCDEPHNL